MPCASNGSPGPDIESDGHRTLPMRLSRSSPDCRCSLPLPHRDCRWDILNARRPDAIQTPNVAVANSARGAVRPAGACRASRMGGDHHMRRIRTRRPPRRNAARRSNTDIFGRQRVADDADSRPDQVLLRGRACRTECRNRVLRVCVSRDRHGNTPKTAPNTGRHLALCRRRDHTRDPRVVQWGRSTARASQGLVRLPRRKAWLPRLRLLLAHVHLHPVGQLRDRAADTSARFRKDIQTETSFAPSNANGVINDRYPSQAAR